MQMAVLEHGQCMGGVDLPYLLNEVHGVLLSRRRLVHAEHDTLLRQLRVEEYLNGATGGSYHDLIRVLLPQHTRRSALLANPYLQTRFERPLLIFIAAGMEETQPRGRNGALR